MGASENPGGALPYSHDKSPRTTATLCCISVIRWRDDPNDPATATRVNERKVR
jgi:hypothetical protein